MVHWPRVVRGSCLQNTKAQLLFQEEKCVKGKFPIFLSLNFLSFSYSPSPSHYWFLLTFIVLDCLLLYKEERENIPQQMIFSYYIYSYIILMICMLLKLSLATHASSFLWEKRTYFMYFRELWEHKRCFVSCRKQSKTIKVKNYQVYTQKRCIIIQRAKNHLKPFMISLNYNCRDKVNID